MRLPKQVLVIPYKIVDNKVEYCLFKRKDRPIWQWIAGGVEDSDKDILAAAKRETYEETGISSEAEFTLLEEFTKIPVVNITKDFKWGENVFYSDEYTFCVKVENEEIKLSEEHDEFCWMSYSEARNLLKYDSNKSALWELDEKIKRGLIK